MQIHDIDLNLLAVLNAIFQEKHLTRAGKRLGRTPSAVSHALTRLRELLDDPLFVRQGNEMIPTPVAEEMALNIKKALDILETTLQDRGTFDPERSTCIFIIGLMDYCAFVLLPKLLPVIKSLAPRLDLQTRTMGYPHRLTALENGEVDFIIGCLPQQSANIYQQHLFNDREVCIVRTDHPEIGSSLTLDEYTAADFICLSFTEYDQDPIDDQLKQRGLKRKIALTIQQEMVIPELVSRTDYIANIAEQLAIKYAQWLPIRILPIPLPETAFEVKQFWHNRNQMDPGHRWLRQTIKSVCTKI